MPSLKPVNWKILECIFQKDGFVFGREESSHRSYNKDGIPRPIVIPKYKEVDIDIIKSNMRTAKMSHERYFQLLEECKKRS